MKRLDLLAVACVLALVAWVGMAQQATWTWVDWLSFGLVVAVLIASPVLAFKRGG